jgi:2-oxo-4-hydroxy-4-carboxy--5-ureidoimidazoline (OHCU) decarboxylase/GNAT superfamily N-acetyltransferase
VAEVRVRDLAAGDHDWARATVSRLQGSERLARLGELIDPLAMESLVAELDGRPIGLASVHETPGKGMELVALLSDQGGKGAGTALLETARQVAAASGHHRLWLVTTNDNLPAIHFYLRRGMSVATVHVGAVEADRALKPEIPERNQENGLPIRDLVEFELAGESLARPLETRPFPEIVDLDRLPPEACAAEVAPLFEGGGRFLAVLAEARPFESDEGMLAAAFEVGHGLPESERVELIDSHPRIGADAATVSEMSHVEQGYDAESDATDLNGAASDGAGSDGTGSDGTESDDEEAREEAAAHRARETALAYEELTILNELYERHFGFRYVVFVAGRPKTEIVPLLERALRNDREVELRRGVDDVIYIAGDRLRRLRGLDTEG